MKALLKLGLCLCAAIALLLTPVSAALADTPPESCGYAAIVCAADASPIPQEFKFGPDVSPETGDFGGAYELRLIGVTTVDYNGEFGIPPADRTTPVTNEIRLVAFGDNDRPVATLGAIEVPYSVINFLLEST